MQSCTPTWREHWNNKTFGLCPPPTHVPCPSCPWSGRCGSLGMLDAFPLAVFSLMFYASTCHWYGSCLCLTAPGYLLPPLSSCAITPKCIRECSWTTTNQGLQKGCIFLSSGSPLQYTLSKWEWTSCASFDSDLLGETFMALWPGARDDLGGEGPAAPRASLPARVGGRRKQQVSWINQPEASILVEVSTSHAYIYAHRNAIYYSQFHMRQVFLLIDYESRTISVVFSMLHMLCWYAWRVCAQHRHRLSIKLGKELPSQTEAFFPPFSCIPKRENYLEVSCVLNQCTGSICKGKGSSECML